MGGRALSRVKSAGAKDGSTGRVDVFKENRHVLLMCRPQRHIQQNPLGLPILYLSRHIIAHKADYYRLLLDVTGNGAWEPWILFMLQVVEETAQRTTAKIGAIRRLAEHTSNYIRDKQPKIYSRELVDVIFEQPYCRIANLVDKKIAQRQAASSYLKDLVSIGILRE